MPGMVWDLTEFLPKLADGSWDRDAVIRKLFY